MATQIQIWPWHDGDARYASHSVKAKSRSVEPIRFRWSGEEELLSGNKVYQLRLWVTPSQGRDEHRKKKNTHHRSALCRDAAASTATERWRLSNCTLPGAAAAWKPIRTAGRIEERGEGEWGIGEGKSYRLQAGSTGGEKLLLVGMSWRWGRCEMEEPSLLICFG
jgi:hypothetical protein